MRLTVKQNKTKKKSQPKNFQRCNTAAHQSEVLISYTEYTQKLWDNLNEFKSFSSYIC